MADKIMSEELRAELQALVGRWHKSVHEALEKYRHIAPDASSRANRGTSAFSLADMGANYTLGLSIGYSVAIGDLERILDEYADTSKLEAVHAVAE